MKLNEFIDKWVVAYESKEQKEEYALEIVKDIESLEYRSQSELPSDEQTLNKISNIIIRYRDEHIYLEEAEKQIIEEVISPLLSSRDARIKELEECLISIREKIQLNGETVRTARMDYN